MSDPIPSSGSFEPSYWRSLEELAAPSSAFAAAQREDALEPSLFEREVARREFLRLMAAPLAALGLGSCTRQPDEEILPYARTSESAVPGRPRFFATAMSHAGGALGLLVESHMGRPTKIEGNPDHPASLGATDAVAQAAVLALYDPDRSRAVLRNGAIATWEDFQSELRERASAGGEGLRLLSEPLDSPSLAALVDEALRRLPGARWHTWSPVHRDAARAGAELAFGRDVEPRYFLDRARVVLSLDADLFGDGPARVRQTLDFAAARRATPEPAAAVRLYALESSPTLTGAMADHRLALRPAEIEAIARALAAALGLSVSAPELSAEHARFVTALADDLRRNAGAGVVAAGRWAAPAVHALAHGLNGALGNLGATVELREPPARCPEEHGGCVESLAALVEDMRAGRVATLLMLGGNPVLSAPCDLELAAALQRVPFRAHLAQREDETSRLCHWHVPEAHFLESWGDARAFDGTVSMIQPLIAPLYGGRTAHEVVALLNDFAGGSAYDLVRRHWRAARAAEDDAAFERVWRTALHDGVLAESARASIELPEGAPDLSQLPPQEAAHPERDALGLLFRPDASVFDGRFANNAWLQELPRPLSLLTWDNAALLAPATAARLGLASGDVVRIESAGRALEAPVWVLPGHAQDCVTLHLGYGRSRAGRVGDGVGFDAYRLRTAASPWTERATLVPTGARHAFACVQDHSSMEGRRPIREATFESALVLAGAPETGDEHAARSLYPEREHAEDTAAWGMVIDLTTCIGCNACMIACQAENNVPVVGKDEVAKGREMHWIRVDRYYAGTPDAPVARHQPVPCMHCELAPCEPVCPVGATVHGAEGLNEMVYNRCVGTRYCANNCPYKVRRFNFYRYADWGTEVLKLGRNPDVTVRSRGVMEKCTYCVQRLNQARITAKKEGRALRDGDAVTACQQVCPARAIVFGDLTDGASAVSRARRAPHGYALLAELGTRPRTTYLAKLTNPNAELSDG